MKFTNKVKKFFGMKYTGYRGGEYLKNRAAKELEHTQTFTATQLTNHIINLQKHRLELQDDVHALQAKYSADNITIVVYDSNSNVEFMVGPSVKKLEVNPTPSTTRIKLNDFAFTKERTEIMKKALKKLKIQK